MRKMGKITLKKIYIHVGAGKTGTSALQAFLYENRSVLKGMGVEIPEEGSLVRGNLIAHHPLSGHLITSEEEALTMWRDLAKSGHEVSIVSSENMHSKISSGGGIKFFESVREILSEYDVKIVFYIRRHSQWLQSAYAQWVKGQSENRSFEVFAKWYPKKAPQQILDFSKVFGISNVIVRPYERCQFHGGDIFKDFMNASGIDWNEKFTLPKGNPNPRFSIIALELKRRANKMFPAGLPRDFHGDLMEYSRVTDEKSDSIHHSHNISSIASQLDIERSMEPSYRDVAMEVMGREDGKLFLDDLPSSESSGQEHISMDKADISDAIIFQNIRLYKRVGELNARIKRLEKFLEGRDI